MICEKPDRAYFLTTRGEPIMLVKISEDKMDKILAEDQANNWRAYPTYFTESKRIWPVPPKAEPVQIFFEQEIV